MMSAVITRKYDPPAIDRGEILRYMGCRAADAGNRSSHRQLLR